MGSVDGLGPRGTACTACVPLGGPGGHGQPRRVLRLIGRRASASSLSVGFALPTAYPPPQLTFRFHPRPSSHMAPFMLPPAIRFVAARGAKAPEATVQLLCHVKPGVHADREGIASVTSEAIQVCVAARAREGEANRAVRNVIAEVCAPPFAFSLHPTLPILTCRAGPPCPQVQCPSGKGAQEP